jgi:hypothetical protein
MVFGRVFHDINPLLVAQLGPPLKNTNVGLLSGYCSAGCKL